MQVKNIQKFLGKKGLPSIYRNKEIMFLYNDKSYVITYVHDKFLDYKFYNIVGETLKDGDSCLSYNELKNFLNNLIK